MAVGLLLPSRLQILLMVLEMARGMGGVKEPALRPRGDWKLTEDWLLADLDSRNTMWSASSSRE